MQQIVYLALTKVAPSGDSISKREAQEDIKEEAALDPLQPSDVNEVNETNILSHVTWLE